MPSVWDVIDSRNDDLKNDAFNNSKNEDLKNELNRALNGDEDARRELDILPKVERDTRDKGLDAVKDEALKYVHRDDANGGKGMGDNHGPLIAAIAKVQGANGASK